MSRVAEGVSPLELADYQKAVRLVLRHPLVTSGYPDRAALATVRRWADQLRTDLMEVLGCRLVTTADTAPLQRTRVLQHLTSVTSLLDSSGALVCPRAAPPSAATRHAGPAASCWRTRSRTTPTPTPNSWASCGPPPSPRIWSG